MKQSGTAKAVALCSAASILAICAATPSFAQETPTADESVVVVTGIRNSQKKAVSVKRDAAQVLDSISSEDIGKFPDATISDSLQRIPGIQVRRDAGEAGAVNIRGLPQVNTFLNGEVFLGANSITNVQPNYGDIPSQLMSGADVFKSTTASQLGAGITGTVNLKTWKPFDLKRGLTLSAAAEGQYGSMTEEWEPSYNALASWRNGQFGALLSVAYSDTTASNHYNGMSCCSGWAEKPRESAGNNPSWTGFGKSVTDPVTGLVTGLAFRDGDQNGDGDVNDAFIGYQGHTGKTKTAQRQRLGINGAFEARFGDGYRLNAELFHTEQTRWDREVGIDAEHKWSTYGWFEPVVSRNTGVDDINTVSVYKLNARRLRTYSQNTRTESQSDNFSLALAHDNGGNFTWKGRIIHAKATQEAASSIVETTLATDHQWGAGRGNYPTGFAETNPNGYNGPISFTVDYRGDSPVWSGLPADRLGNVNNYAVDGMAIADNFERDSTVDVARFDGRYTFGEGASVEFGVRSMERKLENKSFDYVIPMYAAQATNGTGCLVKWKSSDVLLNNTAGDTDSDGVVDPGETWCTAGDANGYYTALRPMPLSEYGSQVTQISNFGGISGMPNAYALDPYVMDDPVAFQDKVFGAKHQRLTNPGASYKIGIKQTAGYIQGNVEGVLGVPFDMNAGVQVIKTELDIDRHLVGDAGAYGAPQIDKGTINTKRSFTDVLPSFNANFSLREDLKFRVAYSKNMTMLDAEMWGGSKVLAYSPDPITGWVNVIGGSENGSPDLDPWRSDNFDASLEWYNAPGSLFSVAVFYVKIASFIERADVSQLEKDQTGGGSRMVNINKNVQGRGGTLSGIELNAKQAFTYLPGFWSNFGVDANYTYSPSESGKEDLDGESLSFQDNSKHQANFATWYQNGPLQARVAYNYRSKRNAATNQVGGTAGLTLYQQPTHYVDASVSYDVNPNITVYLQGSNLTEEKETYYLQWKEQYAYQYAYDRRISLGVRAKF